MAAKPPPKLLVGAAFAYVGVSTATYIYLKSTQGPGCNHDDPNNPSTAAASNVFDRIAPDYDSKIQMDEFFMGVGLLRRWIIKKAQGEVLEISAGTARNLKYYPFDQLKSVTITDNSKEMLKTAYDKARDMGTAHNVRMCLADAQDLCSASADTTTSSTSNSSTSSNNTPINNKFGPAVDQLHKFPPNSFDTVIDTFGLCSQEDPVQVLKEMAKVVKPGGRLLLLEHGKSNWGFVNNILDDHADKHKTKWGCQWNRDILDIVATAGLKVEWVSRWHFGSTYVISCTPSPSR